MLKSTAFAALCSLIAGCSTQPALIEHTQAVEVKVPISTPCVTGIPASPAFLSDSELLTGPGAQVFDQVWRVHLEQRNYIEQLVAMLTACVVN